MTIGTPTILGSATTINGSNQTIITTTATVAANSFVVVGATAVSSAAGISVSSVSDGTHTYTGEDAKTYNTTCVLDRHTFFYTSSLASGATITVTWNQGAASGAVAAAIQVSGLSTFPHDVAADNEATATSSAPSVATTPSTNNEFMVGILGWDSASAANYTENSPFTNLYNNVNNLNARLSIGYDTVSTNSLVTYAPSLSASRPWGALIAGFTGASTAAARLRTRMTMGAGI